MKTLAPITVGATGSAVALTSSTIHASWVCVQAHPSNTAQFVVGDSNVSSTAIQGRVVGNPADADEKHPVDVIFSDPAGANRLLLNQIYVEAVPNDQIALITYITE